MSPRVRYLTLVFLLAAAAVCVRLGAWQLSRLTERRATNAAALAQRTRPEVPVTGLQGERSNRRVRAAGSFDRAYEVVIRGQAYREAPGVHVVTPLRLEGSDSAVLVNRGFLPAADGATADLEDAGEPGPVEVAGIAFEVGSAPDSGQPVTSRGQTTWRRVDLAAVRARTPYPVMDVVIVRGPPDTAGPYPRRVPPPALSDGPHLNYAIQWFSFATIAAVGGVILFRRSGKPTSPP